MFKKNSHRRAVVAVILVLIVFTVMIGLYYRERLTVRIRNSGSQTLYSLVVHVKGASYSIGDLGPGQSSTTRVVPTGESHVEISFKHQGIERRLVAGSYFEPGYRGTVEVEMDTEHVLKVSANLGVRP
jgi:hypothetical protein